MENFIWAGAHSRKKSHLTKLSKITLPKDMGGWWILELHCFSEALLIKLLWRGLFRESNWSKIIQHEYLKNKDFIFWYHFGSIGKRQGSTIWSSFSKIKKFFIQLLTSKFQIGNNILIGFDPTLGAKPILSISGNITHLLNDHGFFSWGQVINGW